MLILIATSAAIFIITSLATRGRDQHTESDRLIERRIMRTARRS